jgi:hypothetical protein
VYGVFEGEGAMTSPKIPDLPARGGTPTTEKTVVTFRFPSDLASALTAEAKRRGWSFNELLVTIAHDYWTWFGCSEPLPDVLDADQKAMDLDRRRYMQRVLNRRYHEILEKGPGFEKKLGIGGTTSGKK